MTVPTRSYQSVLLLDPIQTSLRFIPLAISGTILNIAAGFLVGRARPHYVIIGGLLGSLVGLQLFTVTLPRGIELLILHCLYYASSLP